MGISLDEHVIDLSGGCEFTTRLEAHSADDDSPVTISRSGATMTTDGVEWECPRTTLGTTDYCLFHLTGAERKALGISPEEVADAFVAAVEESGPRVKQFLGASLQSLSLDHQLLAAPDNYPIDLRYATITDFLSVTNTELDQPLHCEHANLGALTITNSRLESKCHFEDATVTGDVTLENQFDSAIVFSDADISGSFDAVPANFNLGITCIGTTFDGDVEFYADFNDEPNFTKAVFRGETKFFVDINADSYFKEATFEGPFELYAAFSGSTRFNGARFCDAFDFYGRVDADAHFPRTTFQGPTSFYRSSEEGRATRFYQFANFDDATFVEDVDFTRVGFVGSTSFEGASFRATGKFDEARFEREAQFVDIDIAESLSFRAAVFAGKPTVKPKAHDTSRYVDFTDAELSAGRLRVATDDSLIFELTRAYVGDVDVGGPPGHSVFDHFVIDRTEFDGFDFSAHRLELAQRDYAIHNTAVEPSHENDRSEPAPTSVWGKLRSALQPVLSHRPTAETSSDQMQPEDLEVTYMKAKNGAKAIDETEAVSQFFLHEMKYRRRRHLRTAATTDGLPNSLRATGRAATNLVMGATCGFGERPWRVVASSAGVIVLFAFIYAVLNVPTTYDSSVVGHAILSIETFVALVLGSPRIRSPVVNLLTSIEAFSGAYFIALFVFTLTQAIRR